MGFAWSVPVSSKETNRAKTNGGGKRIIGGGGGCGREICTICPFCVFAPILWHFLAQFGGNPCSEASCGVVTFSLVLQAFQVVFGSWNPEFTILSFSGPKMAFFLAPKTLRFKGKMANFEAKIL